MGSHLSSKEEKEEKEEKEGNFSWRYHGEKLTDKEEEKHTKGVKEGKEGKHFGLIYKRNYTHLLNLHYLI